MRSSFPARAGDHRLFSFMAIFSALTIVAGFFNTYGQKLMAGRPPVPPIIHLHALVFTAWLAVFVAQTTLVFAGRTAVHKRLMLLSLTGAMIGPGVSRLPFATGKQSVIAMLAIGFLLAGPVYDLITRRRVHRVYWWGVPFAFLATPPIAMALSETSAWQRVASILIGS